MSITELLAQNFPEYFNEDVSSESKAHSITAEKTMEDSAVNRDEDACGISKAELIAYIASMDKLVNSKTKLAAWIINNIDSHELTMSQREIAKKTGISLGTVESTMKILQEGDSPLLIKSDSGTYQLNPDVRFSCRI